MLLTESFEVVVESWRNPKSCRYLKLSEKNQFLLTFFSDYK